METPLKLILLGVLLLGFMLFFDGCKQLSIKKDKAKQPCSSGR